MSLFGGVIPITGITFLMFSIFVITIAGYALGRITIKGVSLGTAGVFIIALLFGCFFYKPLEGALPEYTKNSRESGSYPVCSLRRLYCRPQVLW